MFINHLLCYFGMLDVKSVLFFLNIFSLVAKIFIFFLHMKSVTHNINEKMNLFFYMCIYFYYVQIF